MPKYVVQNIKLPFKVSKDAVFDEAKKRLLPFFGKSDILKLEICKRSIDARKKDIFFVWSVTAEISSKRIYDANKLAAKGIVSVKEAHLNIDFGASPLLKRPLVVGFGPCGMFCALILAMNGYKPIVIERGSDIDKRSQDVDIFNKTGKLDSNSNIQFGAGGAGTFSDGKLVTRINDEKCALVIDIMHRFGAPDDILYKARPHVGTDNLKNIVTGIKNEIIRLGGDVYFDTKLEDIVSQNGKVSHVKTNRGDIPCGVLIMAIGHSSRDTFKMISAQGFSMIPKPFSVGVRVEHLQSDIEAALYGDNAGNPILPKGEYSLSHKCKDGRGVYSFCMCPGGEVVAAASEFGGVVTNGMSNYARSDRNANSAIAVSILPEDFGNSIDGAINFQRSIETRAYIAGGKDYHAPAMTMGDFMSFSHGSDFSKVLPTYMSGQVKTTDISSIFPSFVTDDLREGFADFDKKIRGFASNEAVITAPETRTSSPIRIVRNESFLAFGYENVYPCGEGAGYAGGITSAGVDGINCAVHIMSKYKAMYS